MPSITQAQLEHELFTLDYKGREAKRALFERYMAEHDAAKNEEIRQLREQLSDGVDPATRALLAEEKRHAATAMALAVEIGRGEFLKSAIKAALAALKFSSAGAGAAPSEFVMHVEFGSGDLPALRALEAAVAAMPPRSAPAIPFDREALGRVVRETWVTWAREQQNPKPSWLLSWEEISESDREVDRRIGETLVALPVSTFAEFAQYVRALPLLEDAADIIEESAQSLFETHTRPSGKWDTDDEHAQSDFEHWTRTVAALRKLLPPSYSRSS